MIRFPSFSTWSLFLPLLVTPLLPACKGADAPAQIFLRQTGTARFEQATPFRRFKIVTGGGAARGIAVGERGLCATFEETAEASGPEGRLFLLDTASLTPLGQWPSETPLALAASGSHAFLLTTTEQLVTIDLDAPGPEGVGAKIPLKGAACLAASERLLAVGYQNGSVGLFRRAFDSSDSTLNDGQAASLQLGSSRVSALCFGRQDAAGYLYAGLDGDPRLLVIDLENPSGPVVCSRIDAVPARNLSADGQGLLLVPSDTADAGPLLFDLLAPSRPRLDASFDLRGVEQAHLHGNLLCVLQSDSLLTVYTCNDSPTAEGN